VVKIKEHSLKIFLGMMFIFFTTENTEITERRQGAFFGSASLHLLARIAGSFLSLP
jgi:hypothetical protein